MDTSRPVGALTSPPEQSAKPRPAMSLMSMSLSPCGTQPVKPLPPSSSSSRPVRFTSSHGIVPPSLFPYSHRWTRLVRPPSSGGMLPVSPLSCR